MLQGTGLYGAGDFLMSFLGVIILSFAFKIFDQRRLMVRHAPETLGSCAVSAGVSMVGTAVLCRLAGLDSSRPSSASLHLYSLFMTGTAVLCRLAGLDSSRPSSASLHLHSLFMTGTAVLWRALTREGLPPLVCMFISGMTEETQSLCSHYPNHANLPGTQ